MFLLNAAGGSGKTFLLNHILNAVRLKSQVALATATSGIAATLLTGGKTVHSTFKVPLDLDDESVCNFSGITHIGRLMKKVKLIIIDEVTMGNKKVYECLDRTLRNVLNKPEPFAGITVLFSGDFRQILPVVKRGGRDDIVNACLKRSEIIWPLVEQLELKTNERVARASADDAATLAEWSEYLLQVGDGRIPREIGYGGYKIEIPPDMIVDDIDELINFVFEDFEFDKDGWANERAIIAARNKEVDLINARIMERYMHTESRVYYAHNEKKPGENVDHNRGDNYPEEFLANFNPPGFPKTELTLRKGASIMLMRNLDPQEGHCNGARYTVKEFKNNLIVAQKASGKNAGTLYHIHKDTIPQRQN